MKSVKLKLTIVFMLYKEDLAAVLIEQRALVVKTFAGFPFCLSVCFGLTRTCLSPLFTNWVRFNVKCYMEN